jgi:hypothetical protein
MKRQITAIVACFALALSGMAGTAVEAKSKKNNVVPLILGAAALGLLLNEMNKGKAQAAVPTRGYSPYDDDYNDYYNPAPKPNRNRGRSGRVPVRGQRERQRPSGRIPALYDRAWRGQAAPGGMCL